jgi:transcriptional regulator with XRE-family HTH domain
MPEHIGQTIKQLREDRKLSKARLAREAGFSDAYLVQIEKGDRNPSYSVLRSLAKALRVPAQALLIPAGYFTDAELEEARVIVASQVERLEQERNGPVMQEERDRLLSMALEQLADWRAQQEYEADPAAREAAEIAYLRDTDPLALTDEDFYGWNESKTWAPEHWGSLTDRDRRLMQQMINRLIELSDKA